MPKIVLTRSLAIAVIADRTACSF